MKIAHNLTAMNAQRQFNIVGTSEKKSTEKLASGYKINRAADDAAGLTISEKIRSMIRGLNQGSKNTQDGISWIQVADGAMMEVHDMLHRMKELAVKAANETNTDADREAIDAEYRQLITEIDKVNNETEFNTMDVFLKGNVQLAAMGDPGDLEVFDATYDSRNQLVTYGGLKFHGERIRWDEIDPGMVSTVDGKQVFNAGTYKFSDSAVNSDYYFEVEADGTTEVPYIKRNLEITADYSGIKIDGYGFSWAEIGITGDYATPGKYPVHYGGSVLDIIIGDRQEVTSLEDIIDSINTKNDGVFDYQWITTCIGVRDEQAVDMYSPNKGPGGNYDRTEIVNADMAKGTNCNATQASDPASKLEYTIVIDKNGSDDPSQQTIYLKGSLGGKIAGSEKTLASLGITSWDSDSSIKAGKEYLYEDTSGTKVKFKFKLSDITSFDSVEDGLLEVKLGGTYNTSYNNKVVSNDSAVVVTGQSGFYNVTTFDQEIQLGRDFDKKNYEVQKDDFSYDSSSNTMSFSVESLISGKPDLYTASLSTVNAKNTIENNLDAKINSIYQWNLEQALNNNPNANQTYDDANQKTNVRIGNSTTWVTYQYNRNEYLNELDKALNVEMEEVSGVDTSSISYADLADYYAFDDEVGKYISAKEYMEKMVDRTIREIMSPHTKDNGKIEAYGLSLSAFNAWERGDLDHSKKAGVLSGNHVADYINQMILGYHQNEFNNEDQMFSYIKNGIVNGDYSKFKLNDIVPLYKAKVTFDESKLTLGNDTLSSSYNYTTGRLSAASIRSDMKSKISDTIDNYSEYVLEKINDASSYSVFKDSRDTTATFIGDEHSNRAVRAYYNSDVLMTPVQKGIAIQHSNMMGDSTVIPQFTINTSVLGVHSLNVSTELMAKYAIDRVEDAVAYISEKRSMLGAYQNRLEHTYNNNENKAENLSAAESRIRDTDMATEMENHTKLNILEQAVISMMAQANQSTQGVMALLQ